MKLSELKKKDWVLLRLLLVAYRIPSQDVNNARYYAFRKYGVRTVTDAFEEIKGAKDE